MDLLSNLALRHGTDKGPQPGWHNYTPHYHRVLEPIRHDVKSVLEIGVYAGSSLRMWRDYFPEATIHGLDFAVEVSPQSLHVLNTEPRFSITIGDQRRPEDLDAVIARGAPFDIVIDDGSHALPDYLFAFERLWPHVTRLYVIEDIAPEWVARTFRALRTAAGVGWTKTIMSHTPPGTTSAVLVGR